LAKAPRTQWRTLPLWEHQRQAIDTVGRYLARASSEAALIRMPTGTGKTGVIAVLARCLPDIRNVLILTPWSALRDQMHKDLAARFWERIGVDPAPWPSDFTLVLPSTLGTGVRDAGRKTVFIGTIAALQAAHADWRADFDELRRRVDLVIVDEGHREPAPKWAQAVRDLGKPTVLLTATPYRNDHKLFHVDPAFVYAYPHHQAVSDGFIREVKFHEENLPRPSGEFVSALLRFHRNAFRRQRPSAVDEHRVIVRCHTDADVNEVASALKQAGESVVAIHERFEPDDYYAQAVPEPDTRDATFWVHQNKLIEGIDDPRFSLLALYGAFTNARALVQQVGRILRNPTKAPGQTAHVLANIADRQQSFWQGYRQYETDFERHPTRQHVRQQFEVAILQQPEYEYVDSTYRQRFDLHAGTLYTQYKYPLAANAFVLPRDFSMTKLQQELAAEWFAADRDIIRSEQPDADTWIHTYVTCGNSPLLRDQVLLGYTLNVTVCRRVKNVLFFCDTDGNACEFLSTSAATVPPARLQRLYAGTRSRLAQLSLMNMDLGRGSVRRRTVHAYSVSETAPGLADHVHFCSTALGYAGSRPDDLQRRYVGFTRGRISDRSTPEADFETFAAWIDRIADGLQSTAGDLDIFDRFAEFVSPPDEPAPRNVLFDLEEALDLYRTNEKKPQPLHADDLCLAVDPARPGHVVWTLNGRPYDVGISYDRHRKRYALESPTLERAYVRTEGKGANLVSYLNREQAFRIVPTTDNVIYAHGRFYAPRIRLGGSQRANSLDLFRVIEPVARLGRLSSEKFPAKKDRSGWSPDAVFHLVDTLGRGTEMEDLMAGVDVLICDDAGSNEVADFIAADTKARRVMLIHAKASGHTRLLSASAFAEVVGQALKNLDILTPFSTTEPPNLGKWESNWRASWRDEPQVVTRRLRRGPRTAHAAWQAVQRVIRDPAATREVWIVVGSTFSRDEFRRAAERPSQPPEVIQLLYSLQSAWGAVGSVGARLRVFCSP